MGVSALAGPLGLGSGGALGAAMGPVASLGLAGPGAILGEPFFAAQAQYDAAKDWRQKSYRMTAQSVRQSLFREYGDLGLRDLQETAAAGHSIHQIALESMLGAAATSAGAASAGVSGASVVAAIDSFRRAEAVRKEAVRQNLEFSRQARSRYAEGLQARAYQQIVNAVGAPITSPDYIGMGLNAIKSVAGIVGGGMGGGLGGAAAGGVGGSAAAESNSAGAIDYSEELSKGGAYA